MSKYQVTTVADLRRALDDLEASWTEEDDRYLGEFQHQAVIVPHWREDESLPKGAHRFCGYGAMQMFYDVTGLGFIMDEAEPE